MEKRVILRRLWSDKKQSTGIIEIVNKKNQPIFISIVIERGAMNNQRNVSRIPAGKYPLKFTYSPKFKRNVWLVDDVDNRSGIRIHPANYWNQLQGCIAPGLQLKDLNKDGYYDVTSSRLATRHFERILKGMNETTIEIINEESI